MQKVQTRRMMAMMIAVVMVFFSFPGAREPFLYSLIISQWSMEVNRIAHNIVVTKYCSY